MSNFEPTHKFYDLELRIQGQGYRESADFLDEEGNLYVFPLSRVTRLNPLPQPGEVWRFLFDGSLRIVDDEGNLRDRNGNVKATREEARSVAYSPNAYQKILNSDGTVPDEH